LAAGMLLLRGGASPEQDGGIQRRIATIASLADDQTVNERAAIYRIGGELIRRHPFIGLGAGRYRQEVAGLALLGLPELAVRTHLHSLYLQLAAELGLAGFVAGAAWLLWAVLPIGRTLREPVRDHGHLLLAVVSFAVAAHLVHSCVDVFLFRGLHLLFGMWLGGAWILSRQAPETSGGEVDDG
ncbi:O-antigen ligase family protein, partial [bacterium]|nr:O-antigen ligase family protein [candidate division CSSED10-310 bacterium]